MSNKIIDKYYVKSPVGNKYLFAAQYDNSFCAYVVFRKCTPTEYSRGQTAPGIWIMEIGGLDVAMLDDFRDEIKIILESRDVEDLSPLFEKMGIRNKASIIS